MPRVNLNDLQIGMVTAGDVHDRNGRLLLTAETELTDTHLRAFKTWGIFDVDIVGDGEDDALSDNDFETINDPLKQEETEKMKAHFYHTDLEHPFIKSLFQLCVDKKVHSKSAE